MKNVILSMSLAFMVIAMAGCNSDTREQKKAVDESFRQERSFMDQAIRHRSPDVQRVDIVGNTVVYTHIFDGIIDEKTYTYDGDVCVEAERVYTFPTQMSALRHYRRAVERAELYDNIQLFNNQVKYDLKQQQHELETKGLTMPQLKEKFDKQISDAKADMHRHNEKIKADIKVGGQFIEDDMNCCKDKGVCKDKSNCKKK
jgi:hypothetical protein